MLTGNFVDVVYQSWMLIKLGIGLCVNPGKRISVKKFGSDICQMALKTRPVFRQFTTYIDTAASPFMLLREVIDYLSI